MADLEYTEDRQQIVWVVTLGVLKFLSRRLEKV